MLNLRIVKGPLEDRLNEVILSNYNRLTSSRIPLNEFVHWVQKSPGGPAWHALLELDNGEVAGHTSLIPMPSRYRGATITPAKSEYTFIHKEFRAQKIRGFEDSARPRFVILMDQFFRHCAAEGWGPFLFSTSFGVRKLGPRAEAYPIDFPSRECLLFLNPLRAAATTPNLTSIQRAALFLAGCIQRPLWSAVSAAGGRPKGVRAVPLSGLVEMRETERLSFFEDPASLQWRYLEGQYVRFAIEDAPEEYVIAKMGSPARYLRVCQWHVKSQKHFAPLVRILIREALAEKALGVRWTSYGDNAATHEFARRLQSLGFLCAPRVRNALVHSNALEFHDPTKWKMNDSLFSFDP